jgi:hypothetical protein
MRKIAIRNIMGIAFAGSGLFTGSAFAQTTPPQQSTPATFADGCPAPGALRYACVPPQAVSMSPPKSYVCNPHSANPYTDPSKCVGTIDLKGSGSISGLALNTLFINDANDPTVANHTPRQAQDLALGLAQALQGGWARLAPYYTLSKPLPNPLPYPRPPAIQTQNSQMLAAAMVGNALILNPCMNIDLSSKLPGSLGLTSSSCDPIITSSTGIGIAKLNPAFYQRDPSGQYIFPSYIDFYTSTTSETRNVYQPGSTQDSLLYLTGFFATIHSVQPLYFLKTPINQISMPLSYTSPFVSTLPVTATTLDNSTTDYAVDAFAAFQSVGIGSCLNTALPPASSSSSSSSSSSAPKDPCSHQCRVDAANRVLGWLQQAQAEWQAEANGTTAPPCVEPATSQGSNTQPGSGLML